MYGLMGKIVAQEGQRNALAEILLQSARRMGEVDGCHIYQVAVEEGDEIGVWVYEVWETKAQHDGSLQDAGVRAAIALAMPLIAGMSDRREFLPLGGLGLPA